MFVLLGPTRFRFLKTYQQLFFLLPIQFILTLVGDVELLDNLVEPVTKKYDGDACQR